MVYRSVPEGEHVISVPECRRKEAERENTYPKARRDGGEVMTVREGQ